MELERKLIKVGITEDGNIGLEKIVERVNEGFKGGRVSKQDVGSWIFRRLAEGDYERYVEAIRNEYFDELVFLKAALGAEAAKRKAGQEKTSLSDVLSTLERAKGARRARSLPVSARSNSQP